MSRTARETVSVSEGQVSVQKVVDTAKFDVPSAVFHVESNANEPKRIRIRQSYPETVSRNDIGFHPEFEGECWEKEPSQVVFSREIEPGEAFITVFGVVGADPERDEWMLSKPDIDIIESMESTPEWVEVFQDDDIESDDATVLTTGASDDQTRPEANTDSSYSVISRLATELEEGRYSDEEHRVISEHIATGTGATETKVNYLQNQVSDLTSYLDALEEFFDKHGTNAILDSMKDDIAELQNRVRAIETAVDGHADMVADLQSETDQVEKRMESLTEQLSSLETSVGDLQSRVARNSTDIDRIDVIEDDLDQLQAKLQSVRTFHNRLTTTLVESA